MKLSDLTPDQWFQRLEVRRVEEAARAEDWWAYYEGRQPLYYVAKIILEQENRFPALTINWCERFVDWIDERSCVEGFRGGGLAEPDDELWQIWKRNELDEEQSENNVASLVTGASYLMVAPGDDGRAVITVEAPESIAVEIDPRTRKVVAALKRWRSEEPSPLASKIENRRDDVLLADRGELWLPGKVIQFEDGEVVEEKTNKGEDIGVFPVWNRRRKLRGRSELNALKPVVDAANQTATNMLAGVEHHAVSRKWAVGAREQDFVDAKGNPVPAWKIATGAVWAVPFDPDNPEGKVELGEFKASDLRNFHETVSLLGRIGAGLCSIAPHEFGFGVADNPASADGIEAAKESGVRRVERVLTSRGAAYAKAMRYAGAIEGRDPETLVGMETIHRDPSTPTRQAKTQAAVTALTGGLIDKRQAREDAGYSPAQIAAMEAREQQAAEEARSNDTLARVADGLLNASADLGE